MQNGSPLIAGQDSGFLLDSPTRKKIDLSGDWEFLAGEASGTVKVPSAYDFEGSVTFKRTFTLSATEVDSMILYLVMSGVNYSCEVSVNGEFITGHTGGYTSFTCHIPKRHVTKGEDNEIVITVDNTLNPRTTVPTRTLAWGWRNYGGITRDIYILAVPKVSIQNITLKTSLSGNFLTGTIDLGMDFDGDAIEDSLMLTAPKGSSFLSFLEVVDKVTGEVILSTPPSRVTIAERLLSPSRLTAVIPKPKLWSPETPDLYMLRNYLAYGTSKEFRVLDEYDLTFGFRSISLHQGDISINGRRITLKGVSWYEESPSWGSSMTVEDMERDIVLIKNLGANLVRFINHPPHPYMVNLCDRYGLLAMEEVPVTGVPPEILSDEKFSEQALMTLAEMISRDRHHPSVFAWGIGDDLNMSSALTRNFVMVMAARSKSMDDRPVYLCSRPLQGDTTSDAVDFVALNSFAPDAKTFRAELEDWRKAHPGKPALVGRFGMDVLHGNRNGTNDPLSYETQARFFFGRLDIIKSLEYDGAIVWAFNDWKGDRPSLLVDGMDPWIYTMGLVSYQREKRLAYDAVRSVFRSERFGSLQAGVAPPSSPIVYVLTGIAAMIVVAYFYNASRRFREGLSRSIASSYNFYSDVRDQHAVPWGHSALLGLFVSVAAGLVGSSLFYHFRNSWILDNVLTMVLQYDDVKEAVIRLIRQPLTMLAVLTGVVFVKLLIVSVLLLMVAPLMRAKLFLRDSFTVTMWSTAPLLILIPVGTILSRVVESPAYELPALLLPVVLGLWVFLRWMKGVSIVADVPPLKIHIVGILMVVIGGATILLFLDEREAFVHYVRLMASLTITGSN